MRSRSAAIFCIAGLILWFASAGSDAQTTPSVAGLPSALTWRNTPRSWNVDRKNVLTISSGKKTDWFVDPFDGTVAKSAPILLFTPGSDYVLSAQVTMPFTTKWDAAALMPWATIITGPSSPLSFHQTILDGRQSGS
jgi:Protein of unknown function (DUF1349)